MKKMNLIFLVILFSGCSAPTPIQQTVAISPDRRMEEQSLAKDCRRKFNFLKKLSSYADDPTGLESFKRKDFCSVGLKRYQSMMQNHSGKVGLIHVEGEQRSEQIRSFQDGLERARSNMISPSQGNVVTATVKMNHVEINKAIAKLYFKEKIGTLIALGSREGLEYISKIQEKISLPTIYISNEKFKNFDENAFHLFPNNESYAQTLADNLKARNIKSLAVLLPEHLKDTSFYASILRRLKASGIELRSIAPYFSLDFYSMKSACEKIFTIDRNLRRGEYLSILRAERRKAQGVGMGLNPRSVFLPAQVDFDAVFIPDNFKVARHFVKLFKYFKARRIPLVGIHEWRAQDLLNPREKYLEGSFFVDFVGAYNQLPLPLVSTGASSGPAEIFMDPHKMANVDFQLIGHYAGEVALSAARSTRARKDIKNYLMNLSLDDNFLGKRRAFKEDHFFNWPMFTFEVSNSQLNLISKNDKFGENRTHGK